MRHRLMLLMLVTCCAVATSSEAAQNRPQWGREPAVGTTVIGLTAAALCAALSVQRARRRHAEQQLHHTSANLRASNDRIRDMSRQLLTARETERVRIARELHDDIGQQLALLRLTLHQSSTDEALGRVAGIEQSVRTLSHRLHPARVHLIGLLPALRTLASDHSRGGLAVSFTHGDILIGLTDAATLCLFRVVQEALQNAVRHSQATRVSIDLRCQGDELTLTIVDDGVGFDPEAAWSQGLGLMGIRERVESLEGTVTLRSRLRQGTRFDVTLPLSATSSASRPAAPSSHREPAPRFTVIPAAGRFVKYPTASTASITRPATING